MGCGAGAMDIELQTVAPDQAEDMETPSSSPGRVVSAAAFANGSTGGTPANGQQPSGGAAGGSVFATALESPTEKAVHRLQLLRAVGPCRI